MASELVFELPSELETIEGAVAFVMERCEPCWAIQRARKFNFQVALCEALSNAILYGNRRDPDKRVRVEVVIQGTSVTAEITDEGSGFDPSLVPDPREPENIMRSSGRGLFLMRELVDEVRYNDRGNSVALVLRWEGCEDARSGE
jgi:serine/threonine-protein kinase RsbW